MGSCHSASKLLVSFHYYYSITLKRFFVFHYKQWFSVLVVIWSFVVLVSWRKRSNFLAWKWGTIDYKEEEIARPEFKGTEYRVSPITNTYELYYPPWKRWLMMCISIPLTTGFGKSTTTSLLLYCSRTFVCGIVIIHDLCHLNSFSISGVSWYSHLLW